MAERKKSTDYDALRKLAGAFRDNKSDWEKIKDDIYKERKIRTRKFKF